MDRDETSLFADKIEQNPHIIKEGDNEERFIQVLMELKDNDYVLGACLATCCASIRIHKVLDVSAKLEYLMKKCMKTHYKGLMSYLIEYEYNHNNVEDIDIPELSPNACGWYHIGKKRPKCSECNARDLCGD